MGKEHYYDEFTKLHGSGSLHCLKNLDKSINLANDTSFEFFKSGYLVALTCSEEINPG